MTLAMALTPGAPVFASPVSCSPAAGGGTCGAASGVASQGGQGSVDVGIGNPVNPINGNKYQREEDLPALPGVLGLEIVRHYNSAYSNTDTRTGILGRGWKLSYETELYSIGGTIQIMQADGTRVLFSRNPANPSRCSTSSPANGSLRIDPARSGGTYTWTWTNGRVLNFDHRGKLLQIVAPTGEFLSLQRDAAGLLMQVTDPQGRQLRLQYMHRAEAVAGAFRGVAAIASPVGRFTYRYGTPPPSAATAMMSHVAANLATVDFPDQVEHRQYHYEDRRHPTYLTGISAIATEKGRQSVHRTGTYLYDAQGRAVLTVRGEPARLQAGADGKPLRPARLVDGTGIGQVTLDYSVPGKTVIANSLGQTTVYRHAVIGGQHRLLEAIGAGCRECGPVNVRYGWRADGRLASTTTLTDDGTMPVATLLYSEDARGRRTATMRQAYGRDGHPSGPRRLVQRQEFGAGHDRPLLIARPSVVAGAEHRIRIEYGASGAARRLPVRITETGFVPPITGTVARGIERSMAYRYDALGARIVADGPLPNAATIPGPSNSDITQTEYDPATHLVRRIIAPGNRQTEIVSRDAALRPVLIRTTDGVTVQTTTIVRNWRGQALSVRIDAEAAGLPSPDPADAFTQVAGGRQSRTLQYRYDGFGRLVGMILPGGLATAFRYDAGGRLTHRIMPDGSSVVVQPGTEGRHRSLAYFADAPADADAPVFAESMRYDASGRPTAVDDPAGAVQRNVFDTRGRLVTGGDALDATTRFQYDDNDYPVGETAAFGTSEAATSRLETDPTGGMRAVTDPNGATTRTWHDDFGRKAAEVGPDRGIILFRHDVAGRLTEKIDETGVTTRYAYDHANRILSIGVNDEPALVRYRYIGMRLQDVSTFETAGHGGRMTQQTRYQYDALGQVVRQQDWLARVDGPAPQASRRESTRLGLPFLTVNTYHDAGQLVEQTLPDGHRLRHDYAPSTIIRLQGRPGQPTAIRFDDRIVIPDIRQTAAGGIAQLRAYVREPGVAPARRVRWWPSGAAWFADKATP